MSVQKENPDRMNHPTPRAQVTRRQDQIVGSAIVGLGKA
jgi:hypothetical protein